MPLLLRSCGGLSIRGIPGRWNTKQDYVAGKASTDTTIQAATLANLSAISDEGNFEYLSHCGFEGWWDVYDLLYTELADKNFNLVFEGDSLTYGIGGTIPYPSALARLYPLGSHSRWYNLGVAGSRMLVEIAARTAAVDAKHDDARDNVAILLAGTNDILISGSSANDIYAGIVAWHDARRLAGFKTICVTVTPSLNSSHNAVRAALNDLLRENYEEFSDGIADIALDSRLDDATDTTYYFDGLHMTNEGYAVIAEAAKAQTDLLVFS